MSTGVAAKRLNIHFPKPFLYFPKPLYTHSPKGKGMRYSELPSRELLGALARAASTSSIAVSPTLVSERWRLLTGVEHFAFRQVLSSGAGCQKQGCKEYIYKFLHFILLCIKNLCMCLPPPPSGTPPPGRRRTENDSRGIILLLFLLHYSLTGSTFFFLLNMNSSLRRSIFRRSTRPTPVSVISPSSTLS